jgi:hypothetical protein
MCCVLMVVRGRCGYVLALPRASGWSSTSFLTFLVSGGDDVGVRLGQLKKKMNERQQQRTDTGSAGEVDHGERLEDVVHVAALEEQLERPPARHLVLPVVVVVAYILSHTNVW